VSSGTAVVLVLIFDDGAPKQKVKYMAAGARPARSPAENLENCQARLNFVSQANCVQAEYPHSTGTSVQSQLGCGVFIAAAEAHQHNEQESQLRGMGQVKVG
jgi:hypothetical protein